MPPIPPVMRPLASAPTAPRSERTLNIIPRVQAQPFPCMNPNPVASQIMLKKKAIPPIMRPIVPTKAPIEGRVDARADSPMIARLTSIPMIPISICRIARIVTPAGREGLCIIG